MRTLTLALCGLGFGALALQAQSVISVRSGTVHHVEGQVFLNNSLVRMKFGEFPAMKDGQELSTSMGRAEVLLTPGALLRLAENSAVRLVAGSLEDTRVEVLQGNVLLEIVEADKDTRVTLLVGESTFTPRKGGLFRFDREGGKLQVYEGEMLVRVGAGEPLRVKAGRELALDGTTTLAKFDRDETDAFHRWASRRASYLAMANPSTARSLTTGLWGLNGWAYNPYFGLYSFVPVNGRRISPFGYAYWSPRRVEEFYQPRTFSGGGAGSGSAWSTMSAWESGNRGGWGGTSASGSMRTSDGYSGGMSSGSVSSGSVSAAPAASSTPSGGSVREGGVGRGGRGGQ